MVDNQAKWMNKISDTLDKMKNKFDGYTDPASKVFASLDRVVSRFNPTKMVSLLNDTASSAKESKKIFDSIGDFEGYFRNIGDKLTDLNNNDDMLENLEELQSLLDMNLSQEIDLGSINLQGLKETPEEYLGDMQAGIDVLRDRLNLFYEDIIEDKFQGDFQKEFNQFQEETVDWISMLDDEMEDLFHRDADFREFGRDRRKEFRDLENEVEDSSGKIGDMVNKAFSPDTASIAALFSLGNIRGELGSEFSSLEDARREFQEGLGKTREEWAQFFREDREVFNELNRESGYAFSYREDYIQSLNDAMQTGVSDTEVLHKMVAYATEYRDALEGMNLESWKFIQEAIAQMENGEEIVGEISSHIAYLDNELKLDIKGTDLMDSVQMFNEQLKLYDDGSGEIFKKYSINLSEAVGVLEHAHIESQGIMEEFKTVMSGQGMLDPELMKKYSFMGLDMDDMEDQLKSGDFTGALEKYYEGIFTSLSKIGIKTKEDFADITAQQAQSIENMGISVEEAQKFFNNTQRVDEAFNSIKNNSADTAEYIKEYRKENSAENIWERAKGWALQTSLMQGALDLWQRMGMSGEAFLGILIGINQVMGIFNVNLGDVLWGKKGLIKGLQEGKGLLGKTKSLLTGGKNTLVSGFKMLGSGIKTGIGHIASFSKILITKGISAITSFASSLWAGAVKGLAALKTGLIAGAGAAKTLAVALLANPITWIVVGVIALGVAIWQLWKNWDKVTEFISNVWGNFVGWFGDTKDKIVDWIQAIPEKLSVAWDWFNSILDKTPDWLLAIIAPMTLIIKHWDSIKEFGIKAWEGVKEKWGNFKGWFGGLFEGAKGKWESIKEGSKNAWQGVKDRWSGMKDWFGGLFQADDKLGYLEDSASKVKDNIMEKWSGFKDWFKDTFNVDLNEVGELFKPIIDSLQKLLTSISDVAKSVGNFFIDIANSVIGALNQINFTVPVIGTEIGFNIPEIPRLANGGFVTDTTLAMVGEGGQTEAVIPLDRMDEVLEPAMGGSMKDSPQTIVQVVSDNSDVVDVIKWQTKRLESKMDEVKDSNSSRRGIIKRNNPLADKAINLR